MAPSKTGGKDGKRTGEVAELQKTLIRLSGQHGALANPEKRETFRKVINGMTIGIDMSSLFTQMVLACNNEDLVLKKMLYQYIQTYSSYHTDNVLLTVNTLTKDCQDKDPKLRGLALRTLCSLRVANLLEYLVNPLKSGLEDVDPYVRRTAVMGIFKVHHLDESVVVDQGFLERLHTMLMHDRDSQVVANCLEVLVGIEGIQTMCTKETVYHILNILKSFNEWAQCQVMDFVSHYRPKDENEIYEMMNVLDDRLTHSNSAVVLAVCKLYLHITLAMPATHQQVLERVKSPLMTLAGHDSPEVAYAVLSHLHLLISRAPVLFSFDFKDFYCKFSDPTYIKKLKMEVLTAIADTNTAYEICTELSEYVNYGDVEVAREAVRSVGRIALEVPDVPGICDRLLSFLDMNQPHVAAQAFVIIKDLLRRYPERADECIAAIAGITPMELREAEARAAFVWLLGEHGKAIQDAPYMLEAVAEEFASQASYVQLALLTASMKLFFQRPPECQRLLGSVLKAGTGEVEQDVLDRALMYYRLLQHSTDAAQRVVCPTLPVVSYFAEEQSGEIKDRVFAEFNTLSVIFRAPAATFLDKDPTQEVEEELPMPMSVPQTEAALENPDAGLLGDISGLLDDNSFQEEAPGAVSGSAAGPSADPLVNLLDLDDVFGAPTGRPDAPSLVLESRPVLEPAAFQGQWSQLPSVVQTTEKLQSSTVASALGGRLPQHMASQQMPCMAHGGSAPNFKYYFFSKALANGALFLVEAIVNTDTSTASLTIKTTDDTTAPAFLDMLRCTLASAA